MVFDTKGNIRKKPERMNDAREQAAATAFREGVFVYGR